MVKTYGYLGEVQLLPHLAHRSSLLQTTQYLDPQEGKKREFEKEVDSTTLRTERAKNFSNPRTRPRRRGRVKTPCEIFSRYLLYLGIGRGAASPQNVMVSPSTERKCRVITDATSHSRNWRGAGRLSGTSKYNPSFPSADLGKVAWRGWQGTTTACPLGSHVTKASSSSGDMEQPSQQLSEIPGAD